jgi:D-serine deaminase-like pyridoxal phosphate-dependent protein
MINAEIMERNIQKMADTINTYGVALRPHSKTHKMPEIAKKQLAAGAKGITAAKVTEAEVMAQHGIDDIFIAYPLVTEAKIETALRLSRQIHLIVGVDSLEGAMKLSQTSL